MDITTRPFRLRAGLSRTSALVIIAVASVGALTLCAGYLSLQLLWAPVTLPQPNDHEVALRNILELQALALSEDEAGEAAFFVSHIGCASPPVWQNDRVLENIRRMIKAGVEVKLIAGLAGHKGEPLPSPDWPKEFAAKLMKIMNPNQKKLAAILHMRELELANYSAVAGSARRALAYICISEEKYIYPTKYFRVRDNEACQQWKEYLLTEFRKIPAGDNPASRSP